MRQKKSILWICCAVLALLLAGLFLMLIRPSGESRYSRSLEEASFSLEMERLNTTIAEAFPLKQGDSIKIDLAQTAGVLTISIGQEDRAPIYEGKNPGLNSFQVAVPEDGSYVLSVSGKQAKGSISFQILPGNG